LPTTIQIFDNKPSFVENLSTKIALSLSMDESITQLKNEQAIVQLNTSTGEIRVQPTNGWTGILRVPTYMATDEAIVEIDNIITINPDPTPIVLVTPTSITRTALGWAKSPTESVQKYEVRVNGNLVCETASTTCSVNKLIGPKTQVDVTAIGNEGTRSVVESGKYSPDKRVKVFTINFDEEKWEFTPTAVQKLNTYIDIIKREGFTQAFVLGYTDSQGSPSTSVPLSKKRATVTTKYLSDRLPEVLFKWFALGETDPLRKGLDPADFAANRRAEIYVK
jgi:outer membrane protein OmpA-like peptidoglycan-associated protein